MKKSSLFWLILIWIQAISGGSEVQTQQWLGPWKISAPFRSGNPVTLLDKDWLYDSGGEAGLSSPDSEIPSNVFTLDIPVSKEKNNEGYVDISKYLGYYEKSVLYGIYDFQMDYGAVGQLKVGSDDGLQVWCNGVPCFRKFIFRGAEPDQDTLLVPLKKGNNRILLKILQGDQGWGFYARFTRFWPVKEGTSMSLYHDIYPPFILAHSKYPLQSFMNIELLNNGTQSISSASLYLEWMNGQTQPMNLSGSLKPSEKTAVKVPIEPMAFTNSTGSRGYKLSVRYASGSSQTLYQGSLSVREAHPLLWADRKNKKSDLRFVHLTDPHIVSDTTLLHNIPTSDNLKTAVRQINTLQPPPDFVVITGDLVNNRKEGFALFNKIMEGLKIPWICAPGSHDFPEGEGLTQSFFNQWGLPLYFSFDWADGTHLVVLDTYDTKDGSLSKAQYDWLKSDLESVKARRIFIFSHQDMVTGLGLKNPSSVINLLAKTKADCTIFSGYLHTDLFLKDTSQIKHIITPSTAYGFTDLKNPASLNLPGFRIVTVTPETVRTEFVPLGGAPYQDPPVEKYKKPEDLKSIFPTLNRVKALQQLAE